MNLPQQDYRAGDTQIPIFVLSSGRTGSTFLARLIRSHPHLLCVSDLIEPVGEIPFFDRQKHMDGQAFFKVLSAPSFKQRIAYWRHQPNAELLYLHPEDHMVSLLLSYTLPFLTEDPMALFAQVEQEMAAFPRRSMADQTIAFFDLLRDKFSKQLWVERTGGSLAHTQQMIQTWPHAKFVHNFRDPRETVISMMTGSFFRLYLELEKNPKLGRWDWDYMPPIEEMGAMYNRWVVAAQAALAEVDDRQKYRLCYEDLISRPRETLLGFAHFVWDRPPTREDEHWAREQEARIRPSQPKFDDLDQQQQTALERVCRESMELLGYPARR